MRNWEQVNNYHKRSLIETMISRMKTIFDDQMRVRSFENQKTDLLIRCYVMNKKILDGAIKSRHDGEGVKSATTPAAPRMTAVFFIQYLFRF